MNRRKFLSSATALSTVAFWTVPGAYAEELVRTPKFTEGPFYPNKLPLDTDNDLLIINDKLTPATGEVTHLSGRILDATGSPMRNVLVEIWQCDNNGAYLHSGSSNGSKRDPNFQGFGRFMTGMNGEYYFRTIKPVKYPGRVAHIHYKVKKGDKTLLVTQCFVKGDPGNGQDGVYRSVSDAKQRAASEATFEPLKGSKSGELQARFEIVLGVTPEAV